jgi:hypothetical protein
MTIQPKFSDAAVETAMKAYKEEAGRWHVTRESHGLAGTLQWLIVTTNPGGERLIYGLCGSSEDDAIQFMGQARERAAIRAALEAAAEAGR